VRDRLADALVVERLDGHVEVQLAELGRRSTSTMTPGSFLKRSAHFWSWRP
jgi:hypothetical protein